MSWEPFQTRDVTPEWAWRRGFDQAHGVASLGGIHFVCNGSWEWFYEAFNDGYRHGLDNRCDENYRAAQIASTKALREKFKRIREAHKR